MSCIYFLRISDFLNFTSIHIKPPAYPFPLSINQPAIRFRLSFCFCIPMFPLCVSLCLSVCPRVSLHASVHPCTLLSLQFWLCSPERLWECLIVGMFLCLSLLFMFLSNVFFSSVPMCMFVSPCQDFHSGCLLPLLVSMLFCFVFLSLFTVEFCPHNVCFFKSGISPFLQTTMCVSLWVSPHVYLDLLGLLQVCPFLSF